MINPRYVEIEEVFRVNDGIISIEVLISGRRYRGILAEQKTTKEGGEK